MILILAIDLIFGLIIRKREDNTIKTISLSLGFLIKQ